MRFVASCNKGGPGLLIFWCDLGQERSECAAYTTVCLEGGRGDNCGSVFRPFLALSDGGGFAHQTSGLHAERGGNLNVRRFGHLVWRFSRPFSRRFRGQRQGGPRGLRCLHKGQFVAQRSRSRLATRCASRRGSVRTGMSSRVCLPCPRRLRTRFRRASCFLHRLPGSHTGLHNSILAACWKAELCTIGVLETGSWRKPEAPGPLELSRATRCLLFAPM